MQSHCAILSIILTILLGICIAVCQWVKGWVLWFGMVGKVLVYMTALMVWLVICYVLMFV